MPACAVRRGFEYPEQFFCRNVGDASYTRWGESLLDIGLLRSGLDAPAGRMVVASTFLRENFMIMKTEMNPGIRELTNDELEAVGGGAVPIVFIVVGALVFGGIGTAIGLHFAPPSEPLFGPPRRR